MQNEDVDLTHGTHVNQVSDSIRRIAMVAARGDISIKNANQLYYIIDIFNLDFFLFRFVNLLFELYLL